MIVIHIKNLIINTQIKSLKTIFTLVKQSHN